ncbi:MAG TPA: 2Fe-2S iron-sulfur cluster binding domain-containing protein [Spirochaetia bacterium]
MPSPDGRPLIDINDGARSVPADSGAPILFALMREGVFLPSACGGRASCGQCRVRVLEGAGDHLPEEIALLTAEERARGIHLACQTRVTGDVRIAVPPHSLGARQHTARVAAIRDPVPGMREVELALDDGMRFVAGQYVQLLIPGTERDPKPLYRAYSVTSSPRRTGLLSFLVGRVEGGACSTYIFERLRVGDGITLNGPFGEFRLHEGTGPALLVAGGSGIAPMRSILIDVEERGITRPITLFFVVRARRDLVWEAELRAFESRIPGFHFMPILSHPDPNDAWTGEKGGMASVLARLVPRADDAEACLCGAPGMIESSIAALRARGIAEDRVFFDKFS